MNRSGFIEPWTTVVIGGGRIWTGHARNHIISTLPGGLLSDPAELIWRCSGLFYKAGEGTVLVPHTPTTEWGNDPRDRTEQMTELIAVLRLAGWKVSDAAIRHKSGWITAEREGHATVHLGVLPFLDHDPLIDPTWDIEEIGRQVATYAAAIGATYRSTPGVTGISYIKKWHEHKSPRRGGKRDVPRWMWDERPATMVGTPADIIWDRRLTKGEREQPYVHPYDISKQYLAAMGQAVVSWSAPEPVGATRFDRDRAGLWLIVATPHARVGAPVPILNPLRIMPNGTAWVTTPIMSYLAEYNSHPDVIDSYLSPETRASWGGGELDGGGQLPGAGRWLRPIAERWRDAIVQHGRPVGHPDDCTCRWCRMAVTLKRTGNEAIGMMASPTGLLRRFDVAATIRDLARVNFHRKLADAAAAGFNPVRVYHDAAYYVSDNPDPAVGAGAALKATSHAQIGRLKLDPAKTLTMKEYRDEHEKKAARR